LAKKKKEYNRPTNPWICGRKSEGRPCSLGPSKHGACGTKFECAPTNGSKCSRPKDLGGPCKEGPTPEGGCSHPMPPCTPVRSIRSKRKLVTTWVTAVSIAIVLVIVGLNDIPTTIISPGDLSSGHSSINHNCTTCHNSAHKDLVDIVTSEGNGVQDSKNCLECHALGAHPFKAHNMASDKLDKSGKSFNCNLCHKEHRGANVDLKKISDNQCQSCHAKKFDSFENGHPEFKDFAYNRRVRILFDHNSHLFKHFDKEKEKSKNITCLTCHGPVQSKMAMSSTGFEKSCKSCHSADVDNSVKVNKGIVFFRVPLLDFETLEEKGVAIGDWPEDSDGEVSSFFKLLLSLDSRYKEDYERVKDLDLSDISDESDEVIESVGRIAWGMKIILGEFMSEGAEGLKNILKSNSANVKEIKQIQNLMSNFPVSLFNASVDTWFPNLTSEVANVESGFDQETKMIASNENNDNPDDEEWMKLGGWYHLQTDFTLRYRPTGHGDKFLQSWIDLSKDFIQTHSSASDVFNDLTDPKESPGSCMKCHSVDKVSENKLVANWKGKAKSSGIKEFVTFDHSSHFSMIGDKGCFKCHSMNHDADFSVAFTGNDIKKFNSNFNVPVKGTCTSCHQEGKVSNSCLTCHNYHIIEKESKKTLKVPGH
jgi:hypothetical protein